MQINDFIDITNKAEKYFEKEYTNEQRKIMFKELEHLSKEQYSKAIDRCIRTCRFLPKIADILDKKEVSFEQRDYSDFDFNSLITNKDEE